MLSTGGSFNHKIRLYSEVITLKYEAGWHWLNIKSMNVITIKFKPHVTHSCFVHSLPKKKYANFVDI